MNINKKTATLTPKDNSELSELERKLQRFIEEGFNAKAVFFRSAGTEYYKVLHLSFHNRHFSYLLTEKMSFALIREQINYDYDHFITHG